MDKVIERFMEKRPKCEAIIGYGSGITKQKDQENRKVQIDLIVVVKDLKRWHKANVRKNPNDYSFTGKNFLTNGSLSWLKKGGKICYLTYIPFEGHSFKIGTIEEKDFLDSLELWDTFYLAGRMQKPIKIFKADTQVKKAIESNRRSAIATTLLLSDERKIPMVEFYETLVSLSYMGDTRMKFAENPHKVSNIVKGGMDFFDKTYGDSDLFNRVKGYIENKHTDKLMEEVPILLRSKLKDSKDYKETITKYLEEKNKKESMMQTIKGIFTSGPVNSVAYACAKLKRGRGK